MSREQSYRFRCSVLLLALEENNLQLFINELQDGNIIGFSKKPSHLAEVTAEGFVSSPDLNDCGVMAFLFRGNCILCS